MMNLRKTIFFLLVTSSSILSTFLTKAECPIVETVENFDIEEYASSPWYIHQQAVNAYSPIELNFCTTAQYTLKDQPSTWGYTVDVYNSASNEDGLVVEGPLCAYQTGDSGTDLSKLAVAPCFLPTIFSGPYWVVAYNESEGYALVSGGQPTEEFEGGCRTGTGVNNSGLWILTRSSERDEDLINTVRGIASDAGFDISVFNDVDHTNCDDLCSDVEGTFPVGNKERDCAWVANWKFIRCLSHGDKCPETCGLC